MKLITNKKIFTDVSFLPITDGCTIVCGESVVVGDTLRIEDNEGVLLREYTVADYLRCVVDGCAVQLTNMPETVPEPPMPPEPSDMELTQQDITDLQLANIEMGQEITDLQIALMEVSA